MDADTETTSSHSTALHYIRQRAALHYQSGMYMRPFLWRPSQTETLKPETEAETEALTIQAEARPRPRPSELETETRPRHINSDVRLSRNTTAPRDGRDRGVKTEATSHLHIIPRTDPKKKWGKLRTETEPKFSIIQNYSSIILYT